MNKQIISLFAIMMVFFMNISYAYANGNLSIDDRIEPPYSLHKKNNYDLA